MQYSKPALTSQALLGKMSAQGFVVDPEDQAMASCYLDFVGAHRIKGYWHKSVDPMSKQFRPDRSNFKYLSRQIQFDESLRQLLWRMLERVELAIRSIGRAHV